MIAPIAASPPQEMLINPQLRYPCGGVGHVEVPEEFNE